MVADMVADMAADIDMKVHMVADMEVDKVADQKIFFCSWLTWIGHGGRQGCTQDGRHGGWSRVLVNWAKTFSTRTLGTLSF